MISCESSNSDREMRKTRRTLKMTTAQIVETRVTSNSLSKDHPHPDDHTKQINFYSILDSPAMFDTSEEKCIYFRLDFHHTKCPVYAFRFRNTH